MATPAIRSMLVNNGMSSPLQLLRAPLFGASANLNLHTYFISDPTRLHMHSPVSPQYFLGDRANNMGANLGVFTGSTVDAKWRFGGFGETGCVEARGRKVISDDEDVDDEVGYGDFDEDVEDFNEDFKDGDIGDEDEDEGDFDDDDDDDVVDVRK